MRKVWILIAAFSLVLGAMMLLARSRQSEWTTSSRAALAAFERGHEARMKYYDSEARDQFRRALELDPGFLSAKLALLRYSGKEERDRLAEELAAADLKPLTAREQFQIRYRLARYKGRGKEAKQILKSFLDAYPEDPYGLDQLADIFWRDQNWDKAAKVYRRLLEVDPNWVLAQNRLGYLAMAQGRFEEAEELFRTYTFIAPDQANPHDSMGELLTVLGRYEEAREHLEKAISIKSDFCDSYRHLEEIVILEGRPGAAEPILERAEANGCGGRWIRRHRCENVFWADYMHGDFDAPWREERSECAALLGPAFFLTHRMAALSGRSELARKAEEILAEDFEYEGPVDTAEAKYWKGLIRHFKGVRLLADGDLDEAADLLAEADHYLYYWGQDQAILKLFNRLNLACAYELRGEDERSHDVLSEVAAVNPPFAAFYAYILESFRW